MKLLHTIFASVVLFTAGGNNLQAQTQKTWQWVSQLGGRSWDMTHGVVCTKNNDLFVAGSFRDSLFCNSEKAISFGNQDAFIARLDDKGSVKDIWHGGGKGYDEALCITSQKNNELIIGGNISDTVTFGDLSSPGKGTRLFITCLSAKGRFLWLSSLVPSSDASLFLIDSDSKGNIYASGIFSDTLFCQGKLIKSNGKKDIFLARFTSNGTIVKLTSFGSDDDDFPTAFTTSDSGKISLAVVIKKSCKVDLLELLPPTSKFNTAAFILAFDDSLKASWKVRLIGEEYINIASLVCDAQNNIYASGSFNLSFSSEDKLFSSNGYTDGFLLKYNSKGDHLWGKSFGTIRYDYASHIIPDKLGGMIITGSLGDTILIDSLLIKPLSDQEAAAIIQFSPKGIALWGDCIAGSGSNFSNASVLDNKGNLYLTGSFRNTFEKETGVITSLGDQDVFLAKYYNCPEDKAEILGDALICPGSFTQLSVKNGYHNITWNNSTEGVNYILADKPGIYTVTLLDKRGCMLSDTIEVILADVADFSLGQDISLPVENIFLIHAPENFTSLRWQDNSNDNSFLVKAENNEPGSYTIWLTALDSLGCMASDTLLADFYLSSSWPDFSQVQLSVYPNPVNDWLNWSINTDKPCRFYLELSDSKGKMIMNQYFDQYQPGTVMKTNVSDIPPGTYYMRLRNGKGQHTPGVYIVRL